MKLEPKTIDHSVKEQLKDKSAYELWEVLIEKEKEKREQAKLEKQRLHEKAK